MKKVRVFIIGMIVSLLCTACGNPINEILFNKAENQFGNDDFEDAIETYEKILERNDQEIYAYLGIASCYYQLEEYEDGAEILAEGYVATEEDLLEEEIYNYQALTGCIDRETMSEVSKKDKDKDKDKDRDKGNSDDADGEDEDDEDNDNADGEDNDGADDEDNDGADGEDNDDADDGEDEDDADEDDADEDDADEDDADEDNADEDDADEDDADEDDDDEGIKGVEDKKPLFG